MFWCAIRAWTKSGCFKQYLYKYFKTAPALTMSTMIWHKFHQQPRIVRNNPSVLRLNCPPAIPHFFADGNCPAITGATILGPTLKFIASGDVTKRLWETLAASSNPCGGIFFHAWLCWAERTASTMDNEFLTSAKGSPPYNSWDGMRAHTDVSTSCNTSGPGRLNLTRM